MGFAFIVYLFNFSLLNKQCRGKGTYQFFKINVKVPFHSGWKHCLVFLKKKKLKCSFIFIFWLAYNMFIYFIVVDSLLSCCYVCMVFCYFCCKSFVFSWIKISLVARLTLLANHILWFYYFTPLTCDLRHWMSFCFYNLDYFHELLWSVIINN